MPPEGDYEVTIESAAQNETRNGAQFLDLKLLIRPDVNQDGQGETIQYQVWRKKKPRTNDPDGFPIGTIQNVSKCVGFENGVSFASLDEWLDALVDKAIKVTVRHEEYNGTTSARVGYVNPSESPYVPGTPGSLDASSGFVQVDPDALPF